MGLNSNLRYHRAFLHTNVLQPAFVLLVIVKYPLLRLPNVVRVVQSRPYLVSTYLIASIVSI